MTLRPEYIKKNRCNKVRIQAICIMRWFEFCGFIVGKYISISLLEILHIAHGPLLAPLRITSGPVLLMERWETQG